MRKGRFSVLAERAGDAAGPPAAADLLLFDFRRAGDPEAARMAGERARTVALSVPLLGTSDLIWSAALVAALAAGGAAAGLQAAAGLLLLLMAALDGGLWVALRRLVEKPWQAARLVMGASLLRSALWLAAAGAAASAGPVGETMAVKGALIVGAVAAVPVLFTMPLATAAACIGGLGVAVLLRADPAALAVSTGLALFLFALSVSRARQYLLLARARLALEWEAKAARRFVSDFEASGRGWFWETNADGILTYASEPLARHLGIDAARLLGRRVEDVLQVEAEGDGTRRTLGFHLAARFPFSDVVVRAPGADDVWWSLSGSPNFDDCGRFLGFRGMGTNLSEERRTEAERSKLARYDSLTGLPNRATMDVMLEEALVNSAARRRGCALMMIDLDKFKYVNDTLGHPAGDKLLRKVAQRLREALGDDGQPGRLGGDEFQAVLPGVEEEARLSEIARRLVDEVSRPYRIDGHDVRIGASVGIAVGRPGKAYASALVRDADLALYAAKAAGRGTFRFFAPEMHQENADRRILADDLREALARDQLQLLYQPVVETVTEEVVGFESLLRWAHPTRGVVPPSLIIPLAEDVGAMGQIGAWVLRTACAEASKWPRHVRLSVNLSPAQLADPALAATVTAALAGSRLDPERLELEVSEGVFLADAAAAGRTLAGLRALGVRVALDNFGTGGSGLGHLRDAPLDKIKIDRSFVRGAAEPRSRNAAIVRAIVVLAESLGMDTTAEGVETLEELELVRRLGCSQVQGFLFAKPMAAADALSAAEGSRPPAEAARFSRPPRHQVIRMGRLGVEGRTLEVRLRNISEGGAMLECERPLEPGTPVELDLDEAGRLRAEVRWTGRGQVGLAFAQAFELRRLARRNAPQAAAGAVLRPDYLDARPEPPAPAGPSPLVAKKRRGR